MRAHRVFLAVFGLGVALRLAVIIAYRPAFIYGDSRYYLAYTRIWRPGDSRVTGYSILMRPLLWLQGLDAVAIAQHLVGLCLAIAIYALLLRWDVPRGWAAAATIPVLLDPMQLTLEHHVLSDVAATALVVAALIVLVWKRSDALWPSAVAGLLLACALLTRTSTALAIAPVAVYLLLTAGRRVVSLGVLVAAFAVPVVSYAGWVQQVRGTFGFTSGWSGHYLYGRVVVFADCTTLDLPAYQRNLCPFEPPGQRDQDFHMWNLDAPHWTAPVPEGTTRNEMAGDFARAAIRQQPLDYLVTVVKDFGYGFAPIRGDGPENRPPDRFTLQGRYAERIFVSQPTIDKYGGSDGHTVGWMDDVLSAYGRLYVPGPVFALCVVVALAALVRRDPRALVGALFAVTLLAVLLLPAALSVFSWRYQLPQLVLAPIAGALGAASLARKDSSVGSAG